MKIRWSQWWPFWAWRAVGTVESADEVPSRLPRHGVVLVGTPGQVKWISFDCPCGAGHRVLLNADPERRPVWKVARSDRGRLSISPSIDQVNAGRRCHYFIRNGKTVWARDASV